jgi:protocatechuate 3,4-dioxygenase beta subunit
MTGLEEPEGQEGRKTRREVLGLLGGLGAAAIVAGCGGGTGTSQSVRRAAGSTTTTNGTPSSTATTTDATGTLSSCSKIPEETEGPFPADGSNGPNVLTQNGVVRSDIRSSIGSAKGVAKGVPLTVEVTVMNASTCAPRSGAAVYLWHCDMEGGYSMYSQGVTDQNYLRGVQASDANGKVTFSTIFPACYAGRWPHIHFEVFPSVASTTRASNKIATSQMALPADVCKAVYATSGYSQSVTNLSHVSLATDMVFSDGVSLQTPTFTGNTSDGYVAQLVVAVESR